MGRRRKTNKHLPKRMYLKSGGYYFVSPENKWINLGRHYIQAMARYAELTTEGIHCRTVGDLMDRYLAEVAPLKAEATYKCNLKESKFLRAFFGPMPITSVLPKHVYRYMDERKSSSRTRANREVALLSVAYKHALRWGHIERAEQNPCKGVIRFKEKARKRYVTDDEYRAFREFAGDFLAAYMDFKLLTGLRQRDILTMRLDQLKDDGIHLTISKTGQAQIISWSDELRAAVEALRALKRPVRGMYLLCTRRGQPYSADGFRSIWQRKMVKALELGILAERFREHDLRGKTGSDTDLGHATKLLSHSDSRTTLKHYRRKPEKVTPLR